MIAPYIGGEEVNTSPTQSYHRFIINFRDYPLRRDSTRESWSTADDDRRQALLREYIVPFDYPGPVAADWPEVLAIVNEKVRPGRERLGDSSIDKAHKARWWRYGNDRPALRAAITELERVLVNSQISATVQFAFLPSNRVYAHTLNVFPFQDYPTFCALQSRVHETWARFLGSSMKDDLRYTPSDCFETFPFPDNWETHPALEAAGKEYYTYRAALMVENGEGMTKTYNRFHDHYDTGPRITKLRDLHAAMDRAVLDAYGWTDLPTDCGFLLDHAIDEESWGRKRKPYRYRWPDPIRDEVLARLLALNAARAAAETRAGR